MRRPAWLAVAVVGVVSAAVVTALLLSGDDGSPPPTTLAAGLVTATPSTVTPTPPLTSASTPASTPAAPEPAAATEEEADAGQCVPDPGIEVWAQGEVDEFAGRENLLGNAVEVRFRLDAPGNIDYVLLRSVYTEGNDLHAWTEVQPRGADITYDADSGRLTGWFTLSHTVNASGPGSERPERTDVDLVYDPAAERLSGSLTHPEGAFSVDLGTRELPREFFDDLACYPVAEDNTP